MGEAYKLVTRFQMEAYNKKVAKRQEEEDQRRKDQLVAPQLLGRRCDELLSQQKPGTEIGDQRRPSKDTMASASTSLSEGPSTRDQRCPSKDSVFTSSSHIVSI